MRKKLGKSKRTLEIGGIVTTVSLEIGNHDRCPRYQRQFSGNRKNFEGNNYEIEEASTIISSIKFDKCESRTYQTYYNYK